MPSSRPGPAVDTSPKKGLIPTIGSNYFALAVLFSMNLLNYIDRYSFFAVGTQIQTRPERSTTSGTASSARRS